MKKILKRGLIILALLLAALVVYGLVRSPSQFRQLDRSIADFYESDSESVLLASITDFSWDEVCIYPSYSLDIRPLKLPEYELITPIPSLNDDGRWALLFKDSAAKKAFFYIPNVDFSRDYAKDGVQCVNQLAKVIKVNEKYASSERNYKRIWIVQK
ncbi:MAG: hypothetical protein J0M34_05510 [Alphaproteobacteria bacterium]|nr:hypothetical protein [Alphaproteobacteria bacterium]